MRICKILKADTDVPVSNRGSGKMVISSFCWTNGQSFPCIYMFS